MPLKKIRRPATKEKCRKNISKNISFLMREEGRPQKQAVAIALSVARKAGCRIPDTRGSARKGRVGGRSNDPWIPANSNSKSDPLVIGIYPGGVIYSDRRKKPGSFRPFEQYGEDYARVAFLPYDNLVLKVEKGADPALVAEARAHADTLIAQRGEMFQTDEGHAVILGKDLYGPKGYALPPGYKGSLPAKRNPLPHRKATKKGRAGGTDAVLARADELGFAAARDVLSRRGRAMYEQNLAQLMRVRRDSWDRAYTAGYLRAGGLGPPPGRAAGASYKTNDPRGWGGDPKRGAALGRPSVRGEATFAGRLTLRRIPLNQGGYDSNGTYFGLGAPLYWYASDDGSIDDMLRAGTRESAKKQILARYPNARFYR